MAAELFWILTLLILYQRCMRTKRCLRSLTMHLQIKVRISGERERERGRESERDRKIYIQWNSVTCPLGECTGGHSAHANWVIYTCTAALVFSLSSSLHDTTVKSLSCEHLTDLLCYIIPEHHLESPLATASNILENKSAKQIINPCIYKFTCRESWWHIQSWNLNIQRCLCQILEMFLIRLNL